ncbi:hypothetical protein BDZ91DRAFT_708218 [Kalaharituber pfeilii]|nr:hypothetical protein BDZ91DRAFT_708218 [Kalaharituber pfeilii]
MSSVSSSLFYSVSFLCSHCSNQSWSAEQNQKLPRKQNGKKRTLSKKRVRNTAEERDKSININETRGRMIGRLQSGCYLSWAFKVQSMRCAGQFTVTAALAFSPCRVSGSAPCLQ